MKAFVFVVCGSAGHIDTLHFSLKALQKFTKYEVLVLTDSSRNEKPIQHNRIIEVKTPAKYNHHQASIFIKTSAYKYLSEGNLYCYLDTDVVAINEQIANIFDHKTGIINFSSDHCKIQKFSPHAVNCGCLEKNQNLRQDLHNILVKYNYKTDLNDPALIEKQRNLVKKFKALKLDKLRYLLISLRFVFTMHRFKLDNDTYYLRGGKTWVDKQGNIILYGSNKKLVALIEKNTGWRWNEEMEKWISPQGDDPDNLYCNHLAQFILSKFNIEIENPNWQHWNGGVFLFDDNSYAFLESWHSKTLEIFEDTNWKTRDQGTLIATAWEFGLQAMKTLPVEFNFLADYHHPTMEYQGNFTFSFGKANETFRPCFLHIYHHWGNMEWDVWRDTAAHVLA